ncbi:hypothetical protein [Thioalkalivibrio sp. XN279]|uniref:hypothetical protein n=1 Tax=Thioalkalivibrio sp. XN279 TaxID=2714953 RepID=UPI00140A6C91|nr:hypothetical protein [Thioalkalivibrio sp. XN279]NHA15333.1 hypothetical protein [Thioalkalivibrio sp. XN279]
MIDYGDGWTQKMEFLDELNGEYGIFSEYNNSGSGDRYATYSVYSRAETRPVLSETEVQSPEGSYFQGEVNSWIPGSFLENGLHAPFCRFGWIFRDGGSGGLFEALEGEDLVRRFDGVSECGLIYYILGSNWQLTSGGAIQIDYSHFGQTRTRTWYPAAEATIDGTRVWYVLMVENFGDASVRIAPRLDIQRQTPFQTDYCASFDFTQ